jgi:hypothetical protein
MSVNGSDRADEHEDVVVRKAERGWVVGDENVSDLTSAMVLAPQRPRRLRPQGR